MTVESKPSPIVFVLREGEEGGGEQTRDAKEYLEPSNDNVP